MQLPLSNSNATVVFEGVSDSDYRGDMALDDILFIKGDCPSPGKLKYQQSFLLICLVERRLVSNLIS